MNSTDKLITSLLCSNKLDDVSELTKDVDWNVFNKKVRSLNLGPNVYYNSKKYGILPEEIANQYKQSFDKNKVLNNIQYNVLKELLTELEKAGIDVMVFKGAYLLEKFYNEMGLRTMGDVDILIKKEDLPSVEKIINELDFKYRPEHCTKEWFDKNYYRSSLYKKGPVELEVHWNLLPNENPLKFSIEDMWKRAKKSTMCGVSVLEMPIELMTIYLAFHISYCHFFNHNSIKRLYDIHIVISKAKMDWDYLVEKSYDYEVNNFVGIVLLYLKSIFNTEIDDKVIQKLISNEKIKFFRSVVPESKLFDSEIEKNSNITLRQQRLVQLIGIKNAYKYIKLISTKKGASGKWMAALYDADPDSVQVLVHNWVCFISVIPLYLLHKARCLR